MRYEGNLNSIAAKAFEPPVTFLLKAEVSDREHFVDEEHLGIDVRSDGKTEPRVHAAGIPFHRCIDEIRDAREVDDLVEAPSNLLALHAHDRALQEDVFPSGEIGMKPCGQLN